MTKHDMHANNAAWLYNLLMDRRANDNPPSLICFSPHFFLEVPLHTIVTISSYILVNNLVVAFIML